MLLFILGYCAATNKKTRHCEERSGLYYAEPLCKSGIASFLAMTCLIIKKRTKFLKLRTFYHDGECSPLFAQRHFIKSFLVSF